MLVGSDLLLDGNANSLYLSIECQVLIHNEAQVFGCVRRMRVELRHDMDTVVGKGLVGRRNSRNCVLSGLRTSPFHVR